MTTIDLTNNKALRLKDPEKGGSILPFIFYTIEKATIAVVPEPVQIDGKKVVLDPAAFTFCCQSGDNERTAMHSADGIVTMHRLDSAAIVITDIRFNPEALHIELDADRTLQIKLKFELTAGKRSRMLKNAKDDSTDITLPCLLRKIDAYASMRFVFDQIEYESSNEPVQVGRLLVKHSSTDPLAPAISVDALRLDTELDGAHIDSDMKVTFADGNYVCSRAFELRPTDSEPHEFPLYWTPMWDHNPAAGRVDAYTVSATCAHSDEIDYDKGELRVAHNPRIVNFSASISIPTRKGRKTLDLLRCNKCDYVPAYELDKSTNGTFTIDLEFASSAAEALRPSAIVWDLAAGAPAESAARRMAMAPGMKPADAFRLKTNCSGNAAHIRRESPLRASITIDPRHFEKIVPTESTSAVEVAIPISFRYFVDHAGACHDSLPSSGATSRTFALRMSLRMRPNDNWLSIDFGTSAIVARYQNTLLNLKDNKKRLYLKAFPKDTNKQRVNEPANLINSSICFNRASTAIYAPGDKLDEKTFRDLQLHLSPSAGTFDVSAQLPCLKLLMGYKSIKDIFDPDTLKQFNLLKPDGSDACLMQIPQIFELVYKQLFNLYITNLEIGKINRLILSVPNTYTPIQVARLRDIARNVFTEVYPELLDTISESDAVAYYYAAKREEFKGHDPRLAKESVLIYDMGAGTLDITYLTITRGMEKTTVDVKAKSGTAMAGNYIDYVLAQAFVELCAELGAVDGPSLNTLRSLLDIADTKPDVRMRSALREFVRNVIKPAISLPEHAGKDITDLKSDGKHIFQILSDYGIRHSYGQPGAKTITIGDLAAHPCFTDCLRTVTSDLLSDFAARHGIDLQADIDTIIFSGRSSSMRQIRQMVKDALHPGARYANLGTKSLEENLQEVTDDEAAILKNIVSEGTIAYARLTHQGGKQEFELERKAVYATYGVILQDENGANARWIPFDLKPDPHAPGCYKATVSVTISARRNVLRLVQTYTSNPLGNDSMTTDLYSSKQNNGEMTISLRLDPAKDNLLRFEVGPTEIGLGARAQDINSVTLRKSLWPIVFETKA